MGRNSVTEAVVLRSARFAEYHKQLSLLTAAHGIIEATAYGACKGKSKLAGATESFELLRIYLYFEPVKKRYKLSDAELIDDFRGIRCDVKRFYVASVICELVRVTYAGGDEHSRLLPLLVEGFSLLSDADDERTDLLLIAMVTRFLDVIGYPIRPDECERCGRTIAEAASRYVSPSGIFLCEACTIPEATRIPSGGRALVGYTAGRTLTDAIRVTADGGTRAALKRGLLSVAERVAEAPLRSLRGAEGMI